MFGGYKLLKSYYSLAKVKPVLLFFEFVSLLIPSILSVVSTILAANIITAITVYNFDGAVKLLIVDFAFIIVSAISYFVYHLLSNKTNKTIIMNLQNYVYANVKSNKNIKSINMSVLNNIETCVRFNKNLLYKICFFIKSMILLGVIIYFNFLFGLILIFISFISYFLLKITDSKIQKNTAILSKQQLESIELFNSIKGGDSVEQNYNLELTLKDKYFGFVNSNIKTSNRISLFYNINNNFITLILKTTVFAMSIFLISQVKSTTLTLSLYLILTPYLSSSAENLISFFDIFSEFGIIENILNEFDALKFKTEKKEPAKINFSTYNLYFFNISANEPNQAKIENVDLKIEHGQIISFVGEAGSGKRAIFQLLQKQITPTSGTLFIDEKNISDIDPDSYKKLISSTSSKPYFFNVSLIENLLMVCGNKTKITKTLKSLFLFDTLNSLPEKLNTQASSVDAHLLFFLGIARCYLTDSKIMMIYEIPPTLSKQEIFLLKQMLEFFKNKRTVILFVHDKKLEDVCNQTYFVENSKIVFKNKK